MGRGEPCLKPGHCHCAPGIRRSSSDCVQPGTSACAVSYRWGCCIYRGFISKRWEGLLLERRFESSLCLPGPTLLLTSDIIKQHLGSAALDRYGIKVSLDNSLQCYMASNISLYKHVATPTIRICKFTVNACWFLERVFRLPEKQHHSFFIFTH